MSSRKREATEEYEVRHREILRIAAGIIRRKGFGATRIDDIAYAVNLTKAGLYHYVPSKSKLLVAILDYAMERIDLEVYEPGLAESDPERRLRALIGRHARLVLEEGDLVSVLTDEIDSLTPAERARFAARLRRFLDFLRGLLEDLARSGRLRELDPTVAVYNLLGTLLWLPRWYNEEGRLTKEKVVEETTRFVLAGLLRQPE